MISFSPLLPLLQTRGASVPPVTESERFQKERGLSAGAPGPIRLLALRPLQGVWPSPRRVLAPLALPLPLRLRGRSVATLPAGWGALVGGWQT